jgi:DNA-directed RNA polymerase specialized sigma subunit
MTQNPLQKQKLDERNLEILKLYPELTLMEIGKKYNLSKQRVQKIIKKVGQQEVGKIKINK